VASFAYSAINAQGVELSGEISAADLNAAREQLRVKGLLAQSLKEISEGAGLGQTTIGGKKVKAKSLQIFSRQFATMIEAGLNVVSALVILEDQTDDQALAAIIVELRKDVEGGLLLSEAMARHPKVFTRLYVSMVEAGEAAGILDIVLDRVAFQIEKQEAIRRKVKSAMVYPTMVLIFATLVLIGMLMFLVPVFVKIFATLNGQLPTLTRYVVTVSDLLRNRPYIILLIPAGIFGFIRWKKTESGRQKWDTFKLKVPMRIGDTVLKVTMARFSRTLSTLVAAGVDIIKALEITGQTAGNWVIEEALAGVRQRVHEGVPIAQPLVENEIFPPMVAQMVKIGEETGELEKMLSKIADFYEDEVDAAVSSLTSIVEPIMMIGVGIMVGIIIISMYMPMFKMLTLVK
jgi:type IV pilus assembly protein PilC